MKRSDFSLLDQLQTTYANGYYLRSSKGFTGTYVAWCKKDMFTGTDPFDETGNVWFEFGPTRETAIANLWASMEHNEAKIGGSPRQAIQKTVERALGKPTNHHC